MFTKKVQTGKDMLAAALASKSKPVNKPVSKLIKKTGKFQGKSNKLGGGGRFKQMVAQGKSPALAASISRKSLGKAKFQKLAAKGRKASKK